MLPPEKFQARATVTLNVTQDGWTESWQIYQHKLNFPLEEPQGQTGIGATDDEVTFSGDCTVDEKDSDPKEDEWATWKSLVITDSQYSAVYWYVKAPGDTSYYGTPLDDKTVWGDGSGNRKATMTYSFPHDVDDPNQVGDQDGVYYEITAYIYRWDLTVYSESYKVWVKDR